MNKELLAKIFDQFKIKPKTYSHYEQAFTHVSYSFIKKISYSYEKLEFLGDAILAKVVTEFLFKKYPEMSEGDLSKTRVLIVQSKTLARASEILGFRDLILYGGSITSKDQITEHIMEDVFEAFIGAVYLDQGEKKVYDVLKQTIIHYYLINMLKDSVDYKTMLQELMHKINHKAVEYRVHQDKTSHEFTAEIWCNGIKYAIGKGMNIRDAEFKAAKTVYSKLSKVK